MSYIRPQPHPPGFPPPRSASSGSRLGGPPYVPSVAPPAPGGFTGFVEPPESPAWGAPRVPDPRTGRYLSSMSDPFYPQQNVHQSQHPGPFRGGPSSPPPQQQQQSYRAGPPQPRSPPQERKKKSSFFSRKINLNDLLPNSSHRAGPAPSTAGQPPLRPRSNSEYHRPLFQPPDTLHHTSYHVRFAYEAPAACPSRGPPPQPRSPDADYFQEQDAEMARHDAKAKPNNLRIFPQNPYVDDLLDRKWRSAYLPQVHMDNLEFVKRLGEGSSGIVHCCRIVKNTMINSNTAGQEPPPQLMGRLVARKVFRKDTFDSGAVEIAADKTFIKLLESSDSRADDEVKAWVQMHVVRLVGKSLGFVKVPPQLLSEYCEGGEVIPFLEKHRNNSAELRMQFATDLLKAAHVCHAAGIVHLDIKVENCFVAKGPDRRPLLKLGDFGGAMKYPHVGSPKACSFPPPEVTLCERQAPLSPAWDIWATAVAVACILGANRDAAVHYQHTSNVRCHRRQFPIHTINNIAELRSGLLDERGWNSRHRPSEDMLKWLAAAFNYDEELGPKQDRPTAIQLLNAFPRHPYA